MATTSTNGTPASASRTPNTAVGTPSASTPSGGSSAAPAAGAATGGRDNFGKMATMASPSKSSDGKSSDPRVDVKPSATASKPAPAAAAKPTVDTAARAAKTKALEAAVGQIEKNFGKGSIMRLDNESVPVIPSISSGALSLDLALGGKGLPRGRIVEVFGP